MDDISREELQKVALRVRNASDILQGVYMSAFSQSSEGIINAPQHSKQDNVWDWFVENYDLIGAVVNDLHYSLLEQAEKTEAYLLKNMEV